jgi:hypothetical protein
VGLELIGDKLRSVHVPPLTGITLLLALTSLACTASGLAQMSVEPTGCAAEHVQISDAHQPWEGPSSWTATCSAEGDGKKWFCSKSHERVICTEDPR